MVSTFFFSYDFDEHAICTFVFRCLFFIFVTTWSYFLLFFFVVLPLSAKVEMAEAMFEYAAQHAGDLALKVGDKVEVTRKGSDGWWSGTLRGKQGNFPGEINI